jgi:hypothetical protein
LFNLYQLPVVEEYGQTLLLDLTRFAGAKTVEIILPLCVKWIFHQGGTEKISDFRLFHPGLELLNLFGGDNVALLYIDTIGSNAA